MNQIFFLVQACDIRLFYYCLILNNKTGHGSLETNSRIPLHQEERPEQAQRQMDRLYAQHQPHQPADLYSLPDHFSYKTIVVES